MSSSEEDSKIDLLDSPAIVKKKLKKAFCEPGNTAENGLLAFAKHVIFGLFQPDESMILCVILFVLSIPYNYLDFVEFHISRNEANGGNLNFNTYEELEICFAEQNLHPADLKSAIEFYINRLLEPIRKVFDEPTMKNLVAKAYPVPVKPKKTGKLWFVYTSHYNKY